MSSPDTSNATQFYIEGKWDDPSGNDTQTIIDPSTGAKVGRVALGNGADVDRAVAAAKAAFERPLASVETRKSWLAAIVAGMTERLAELADAVSTEMGAPTELAQTLQVPFGMAHFVEAQKVLETFAFETQMGSTTITHNPIGVCALITPWNWPVNQIAAKVAPALAAGCTMVLKPSELAPLSAMVFADIIDRAGVPAGMFNMVHGDGAGVGQALVAHADVDMVSFTGSTRAGIAISKAAADGVKRVALELGGKSACIILDDADLGIALAGAIGMVMMNSGQSCNASTRILVPEAAYDEAARVATETVNAMTTGAPGSGATIGPVANARQFERVRHHIGLAQKEGAELLAGGHPPKGSEAGLFMAPTVLGKVGPNMTIFREEVFGPVATITTYVDEDDAVRIANDSDYGLSGAVWSGSAERATAVAKRLRTGTVHINGALPDTAAPFGGYKASGNGREWGIHGFREFLEVKSIFGSRV